MPEKLEIGQRWKYSGAQRDFTILELEEGVAVCQMNWPNRQQRDFQTEKGIHSDGTPYTRVTERDPYARFYVPLISFQNGTVIRSNDG